MGSVCEEEGSASAWFWFLSLSDTHSTVPIGQSGSEAFRKLNVGGFWEFDPTYLKRFGGFGGFRFYFHKYMIVLAILSWARLWITCKRFFCIQVQNPGPFAFGSLLQRFSLSVIVHRILQCLPRGLRGTLETNCGKQGFGACRIWVNSTYV